MLRTRVGYCGGKMDNPTYHGMGDHTESIQIDYDPSIITYERMLELFWSFHSPCSRAYSVQYRNAVFYHDDEQKQLALSTRDREAKRRGAEVHTAVEPYRKFWLAEDYHQKYTLRHDGALTRELTSIYPDYRDFTNSTAAARLNSWLSGYAPKPQVERELASLGLSERARDQLSRNLKK